MNRRQLILVGAAALAAPSIARAQADRQLYLAKQAGRDRVVCGEVPFMHTSDEARARA